MNRKKQLGIGVLVALGAGVCWVFGHHHNFSRPFSMKQQQADGKRGPVVDYVVCLECGKEFFYDLATSEVGPEIHINSYPSNIEVEERRNV